MKKHLLKSVIAVTALFSVFVFTGCGTSYYNSGTNNQQYDYAYNNPAWAPTYYPGARYYYFPDIETYYDLSTREFIVLNMGQWMFVPSIMPFYSTYDLHNSYVVVVNTSIYQPWMHHHYYVRHYPRYYYIDYYDYSNIPYVRGFNENQKGAIYWNQNERHRARVWDDRNIRSNRNFSYSTADRKVQQETTRHITQERSGQTADRRTSTTTRATDTGRQTSDVNRTTTTTPTRTTTRTNTQSSTPTNRTETQSTRRTTDTNYYGDPIGNPVRVEPQMRSSEPTTTTRSSTSTGTRTSPETTPTRSSSTSGTRR